jgi:deoxyribonuclease V
MALDAVSRLNSSLGRVSSIISVAWPTTAAGLIREQEKLARATPPAWRPADVRSVGGCFVCFARGKGGPGEAGDPGWAGAALLRGTRLVAGAVAAGEAGAAYQPGLLALREGRLLEAAVRRLPEEPDVLLVNATGRDHPRRAGLAFHLGAVLDVPTIGITHRLLLAEGRWPAGEQGATSPFELEGEHVGCWVRTRRGTRPLAVHAAWRTDAESAVTFVRATLSRTRTPEPLRQARRLARTERERSECGR